MESSELACPHALERLMLIVALATVHFLSTGLRVVQAQLRRWVDTHWDRGLSYFKIDWCWLRQQYRRHWPAFSSLWIDPSPAQVAFRQGYPEISPKNKSFSALKQQQGSLQTTMTVTEVHPATAPQPTDIVVTKRRVSAVSGSDLEVVLRAQGFSHLVLCGIATSGVVLSTLREAADKNYELTVLSDCCVDTDEAVQHVLLSKVFPRQAEVVTVEAWNAMLKPKAGT